MNSCGKKPLACAVGAIHSFRTSFSIRRIASISGMQVSVTRFMWRCEQRLLVGGRQIAIVRDALVEIVRNQIENIFFEIRAGAADAMNFVLADHLGQREPEFGRAHRAREGHEHLAARCQDGAI